MRRTTITISLPAEMASQVERLRASEHYTRSELVREALRFYLAAARPYPPTPRELRSIEKGRAAMRRGRYYSLDEFRAWLLRGARPKARAEKPAARPSSRA